MIEQLFNLIQQESQKEIIDNPVIPNEHNNHAVGLATDSIFRGLQDSLSNGGLQDVLGMFTGTNQISTNNPIVNNISQSFIKSLMSKFGIESPAAQAIAGSLIPTILSKLVSKTNDPANNGFDINGILGTLLGGQPQSGGRVQLPGMQNQSGGGIDFRAILSQLSQGGLDSNRDGQIDLKDLTSMVSQIAGQARKQPEQPNQNQGGGVLETLEGLMGN
jgi:hypothetical protein